ncbi:MAG: hypothetical protein EOM45_06705 [Clostridia bacterium]|nr:hypothetical protein [Clostridia bacterium]
MPNNVKHIVKFKGPKDDLDKLQSMMVYTYAGENDGTPQEFFSRLVPMPQVVQETLGIKSYSFTPIDQQAIARKTADKQIEAIREAFEAARINDSTVGEFAKSISCYIQTGHSNWYHWRNEHWGVSHEPEEFFIDRTSNTLLEVMFETLWATPIPIFEAIARQFPKVDIGGFYADEDYGYNCGLIVGKSGNVVQMRREEGTDGAIDFSNKIWNMEDELSTSYPQAE